MLTLDALFDCSPFVEERSFAEPEAYQLHLVLLVCFPRRSPVSVSPVMGLQAASMPVCH